MAQCLEERKALAMERSQVAATRRELEVALQQQTNNALQVQRTYQDPCDKWSSIIALVLSYEEVSELFLE